MGTVLRQTDEKSAAKFSLPSKQGMLQFTENLRITTFYPFVQHTTMFQKKYQAGDCHFSKHFAFIRNAAPKSDCHFLPQRPEI
jgi:hypothetical protein